MAATGPDASGIAARRARRGCECKICWHVYDPAEGDPRLADSAGHAVRRPAARTGPARTARRRRTSSWCCAMTDAVTSAALRRPVAAARGRVSRGRRRAWRGSHFVNPALAVEAVGFAPWEGHWLGVMVTPWFMNLMLAPRDPARWQPLSRRARSGATRFPPATTTSSARTTTRPASIRCARCSRRCCEFEDQATARLVAQLARDALFDAANAEARDDAGGRPLAGAAADPPRRARSRSWKRASTRRCRSATSCAAVWRPTTWRSRVS